MAVKKHSSKRTSAPAQRNDAPAPSADSGIRDAVDQAIDTIGTCDCILAFVDEFHVREATCTMEDEIEAGETYILNHVRDLLHGAQKTLESALTAGGANV